MMFFKRATDQMGSSWKPCLRGIFPFAKGASFCALSTSLLLIRAAVAQEGSITIELNKLETRDQACRAYVVVTAGDAEYQRLNLDLVLFRPDGVIGKRFAVDLAPLKPAKRSVKLFDIDETPCDEVGSVLINDVIECKTSAGPVEDCLSGISVSSLTKAQLTK